MSNEVKVGILALMTIAVSFWGYKFILGKNILLKSNVYKVYYPDVNQMQVGTPVAINGVKIGSVTDIQLLNDVDRTVEVILDLDKNIAVPKNTKAIIISTGFMGGKAVLLSYSKPCSGEDCAQSGDTLEGELRGLVASMLGEEQLEGYMDVIREGLTAILDTLSKQLGGEGGDSPLAKSMEDVRATLANLNSATGQLDALMAGSSGSIKSSLAHLSSITGNLRDNNDNISSILGNTDSLSRQLLAADIEATVKEIQTAISQLKTTLSSANTALSGMTTAVDKINQGEGSLGKLIQDDELYEQLNALSQQFDSLASDIQDRPYRYIPLKGRKKVKKYDRLDEKEN